MKRTLIILLLLLMLCVPAFAQLLPDDKPMFGSQLDLTSFSTRGLVGYWPFVEAGNVVDLSFGGNDGAIVDDGGGVSWVGNGLELNSNSSDLVQLGPKSIAELITAQGSLGILYDSKSEIAAGSGLAPFFNNTGSVNRFKLTRVTDTELQFAINDGGTATRDFTVPDMWDGQTHFIFMTWDLDADTASSYVDGILTDTDGSVAWAAPISHTTSFLTIGGDDLDTNTISGVLRSVYLYDRALSLSEIQALYHNPNLPILTDPIWLFFQEEAAGGGFINIINGGIGPKIIGGGVVR